MRERSSDPTSATRVRPPRLPFAVVLALFFVSGASGLVYEVLWTRRLTLLFGSGLFATSTILATFMGGLAVGAWFLGKEADRRPSPFTFYGWLEIGVGIYALVLPLLLRAVIPLYQWAYRTWDGGPFATNLARLVLSAAIFVVPSLLMGGTLPALSRFVMQDGNRTASEVGGAVGRLYAVNTWGAVVGCVISGFLLIQVLGVRGAELATAAANLAVGCAAILLARRASRESLAAPVAGARGVGPQSPSPVADAGDAKTSGERGGRTIVLFAIAASGFAALGYEVLWTRFLTFFLGNSTYAFSAMLAMFLIGLAAGAAVAARRVDRLVDPFAAFAWIELLVGFFMAGGIALYSRVIDLQAAICAIIPGNSWLERTGLRFGGAFLALVVPTFFLGTTFPLAGRLFVSKVSRVGAEIGGLYAANTLGAILGSVCAGFVLVPRLGFRNAVVFLVCVNAAIALALTMRVRSRALPTGAAALLVGVLAVLALPHQVFLSAIRTFAKDEIVYYRENPSTTVFVTRTPDDERWVYFGDQRASGGTLNLPGHRFWGHLPSLLCERRGSACVICFGSGITLGAVARHPFRKIVCVDTCENIAEAGKLFPENHAVLQDPRVRMVTDDGRNVLLGTDETFDVIVSEPPLLETAGVVNLFTREFYETVKARLAPGGVFCQWVPSGEFSHEQHALLLRTFQDVFPEATFWGSPLYWDALLIGTRTPERFNLQEIARRFDEPKVRRDLEESTISNPLELFSYFGLSSEGLARYCGAGRVITDDRTVLDFDMPFTVRKALSPYQITLWKKKLSLSRDILDIEGRDSIVPWVDWPPDQGPSASRARMEILERAKSLVLSGHQAGLEGNVTEQARLYEAGLQAAPDFTTAQYYAAVNRIERAETAASRGDAGLAVDLAESARPLASRFAHLIRRIDALRGRLRAGPAPSGLSSNLAEPLANHRDEMPNLDSTGPATRSR